MRHLPPLTAEQVFLNICYQLRVIDFINIQFEKADYDRNTKIYYATFYKKSAEPEPIVVIQSLSTGNSLIKNALQFIEQHEKENSGTTYIMPCAIKQNWTLIIVDQWHLRFYDPQSPYTTVCLCGLFNCANHHFNAVKREITDKKYLLDAPLYMNIQPLNEPDLSGYLITYLVGELFGFPKHMRIKVKVKDVDLPDLTTIRDFLESFKQQHPLIFKNLKKAIKLSTLPSTAMALVNEESPLLASAHYSFDALEIDETTAKQMLATLH